MALIVRRLASITFWVIIVALLYSSGAEDETKTTIGDKGLRKPATETNVFNFLRLFIMRMIYGFANMFGLGEALEDVAGGIFAPPEPEYGGLDYAGEDSDYKEYDDYDY